MKYLLPVSIALAALTLTACGESKGEKIAKGVCDCYTSAVGDPMKSSQCLQKQIADQAQLNNDPKESAAYLQKLSTCKALGAK
jgi:hypothetical protein